MNKRPDDNLLTFPCDDFPIKVMGKAGDEFELAVLTIIKEHCPNLMETAIQIRHSKDKTYLALTVHISIDSQQRLDALYEALSSHELVIMVL